MKKTFTAIILAGLALCAFAAAARIARSEEKLTPQQLVLQRIGAARAIIFNGDDFGASETINRSIVAGFREGMLTSTTIMTPYPFAWQAYEIIRNNPSIDAGVHLTLTSEGKEPVFRPLTPAEQLPSIVTAQGFLPVGIKPLLNASKKELELELEAQIKAALANGVDVTHFDCHQGFYHAYDPKMLKVVLALADKYRLPIRWAGRSSDPMLRAKNIVTPDYLTGPDIDGPFAPKKEKMLAAIENLPEGITEFIIHTSDEDPAEGRGAILALMKDPDIRAAIEKRGAKLIGYRALRDVQRELDGKDK